MRLLTSAVVAVLCMQPLVAAQREVIRTDWSGFQQRMSVLKTKHRSLRVALRDGRNIKTSLVEVTDAGLLVRGTRAVKAWKSADGSALIPKAQVASVRLGGRAGHRALLGALAGLGAGAGIGAAVATSTDCYEGPCIILLPVIGVTIAGLGALGGYFVGRAVSEGAPEFILE